MRGLLKNVISDFFFKFHYFYYFQQLLQKYWGQRDTHTPLEQDWSYPVGTLLLFEFEDRNSAKVNKVTIFFLRVGSDRLGSRAAGAREGSRHIFHDADGAGETSHGVCEWLWSEAGSPTDSGCYV